MESLRLQVAGVIQGPPGQNGVDGKSAYEYAVEGGYKGTEEEFAASISKEYSDPIVNSAEGDLVVLNDSAERTIKGLSLTGKTEQVSTTGAQLITIGKRTNIGNTGVNLAGWTKEKISENVYSIENNYQKVIFNVIDEETNTFTLETKSTTTSNGSGLELPLKAEANTTYTFSSTVAFTDLQIIEFNEDLTRIKQTNAKLVNKYTITTQDSTAWFILKFPATINTVTTVKNFQVQKGTTATPYEPYTGGKPSPSPEYPQEIVNAGKLNEETGKYEVDVKFTGKNLFDVDSIQYFNMGTVNNFSGYKLHLPPGNYILGTENKGNYDGVGEFLYAFIEGENDNKYTTMYVVANKKPSLNKAVKITIEKNQVLVFYDAIPNRKLEVSKPLFEKYDFMLNVGEKLEPYQPYTSQTLTLTSDRPLTKWDKLEKRDGVWGWVYKSGEIIFDGSDDAKWKTNPEGGSTEYFCIDVDNANFLYSFCNRYKHEAASWVSAEYGVYSDNGYLTKYFRPPYEGFEITVEKWREFLNEYPLTVRYETFDELSFIPLQQSEQDALNKLTTYYPITVITADGGELQLTTQIDYVADTKNYIDSKFTTLNAALANTQAQLLQEK